MDALKRIMLNVGTSLASSSLGVALADDLDRRFPYHTELAVGLGCLSLGATLTYQTLKGNISSKTAVRYSIAAVGLLTVGYGIYSIIFGGERLERVPYTPCEQELNGAFNHCPESQQLSQKVFHKLGFSIPSCHPREKPPHLWDHVEALCRGETNLHDEHVLSLHYINEREKYKALLDSMCQKSREDYVNFYRTLEVSVFTKSYQLIKKCADREGPFKNMFSSELYIPDEDEATSRNEYLANRLTQASSHWLSKCTKAFSKRVGEL